MKVRARQCQRAACFRMPTLAVLGSDAMIQIQQNTAQATALAPHDDSDEAPADGTPTDAAADAQTPAGDPLAKFAAMYGMHQDVQRFAAPPKNGKPTEEVAAPKPADKEAETQKQAQKLMDEGV